MEWKEGYVTDVEYVRGVYRELAPSALNLVLLIQSIEPVPLQEGFTYCDLGCGQGESVNLFAACHPEGRFHGVDFNYAHIAGARGLAGEAGLDNVTFWEASFADLDRLPLPDFDFVVMHGIYSWVGEENRRHILEFLRNKLKPGGVLYLSYNSLPGWSVHAPLRHLLSSYADTQSGSLEQRVERAIEFVQRLKDAGASIFDSNPSTRDFFDYICTLPRNYLAHEFFNCDWTLFYHADVVRDMASVRLSYAGSASFAENQEMLRFSAPQQQVLDEVGDRVMRETVKDFAVSPLLRRDVFIKGRPKLFSSMQLHRFRSRRLALSVPPAKLDRKALFPVGEVLFDAERYEPIIGALGEGPLSLEELLRHEDVKPVGMTRVIEALLVLLAADYVMPAVEADPLAVEATRHLNRVLLDRGVNNPDKEFLASPVLQNGIRLEWPDRMLVLSEIYEIEDPAPWIWETMQKLHHGFPKEGEPAPGEFASDEESLAELRRRIDSFRAINLPLLRQLGVV